MGAVAVVVAGLAAGVASAQSLGTISGLAQTARERAPLAGAKVTLSFADGSSFHTLVADRRGRYLFDQIPAGYYRITAERRHFVPARFGQRAPNKAGRPIELAAGAGITADLLLRRWGAITGTVVDENFVGIPGVKVQAMVPGPAGQGWRIEADAETDDRGVFRLVDLKAGRYWVSAGPARLHDGTGLLPTFYPQYLEVAQSRPVDVELDRETADIQIQPVAGKLFHLSGRAPNPYRQQGAPASVTLRWDVDSRQTLADSEGRFDFPGLVPRRYLLLGEVSMSPGAKWAAYQPLELDRDTDGITLSFASLPELRLRLVDAAGAELHDAQVRLLLTQQPEGALPGALPGLAVRLTPPVPKRQEGYLASAVPPGEWRLLMVPTEAYVIDSLVVEGKDALPGFLLLPGQRPQATLRLSRQAARVHGRVLDSAGNPAPGLSVFCYPTEAVNRHRLGTLRTVRSGLRGDYRFAGLPEGDYLLYATDEEDFRFEDRVVEIQSRMGPVKLTASGDALHDLRVPE